MRECLQDLAKRDVAGLRTCADIIDGYMGRIQLCKSPRLLIVRYHADPAVIRQNGPRLWQLFGVSWPPSTCREQYMPVNVLEWVRVSNRQRIRMCVNDDACSMLHLHIVSPCNRYSMDPLER